MSTVFVPAILLLGLSSSLSFGMTPLEVRNEIHAQASERHPEPSDEFWAKLGPDALSVIKQMYAEGGSPVERTWLIDGLAHFSDPSVGSLLQNEIIQSTNGVMKKKLLSALIQSQGDAALDFVTPYLKDQDPHIRLEVATAIRTFMSSERALAQLESFQKTEKEAWVKKDFERVAPDEKMKRAGSIFGKSTEQRPLPEKDWIGEWKGTYISAKNSSEATLDLRKLEKGWQALLKLPKMVRVQLGPSLIEVVYFKTDGAHWIEIRNAKEDSVFLGFRRFVPKRSKE